MSTLLTADPSSACKTQLRAQMRVIVLGNWQRPDGRFATLSRPLGTLLLDLLQK